MPLRPASEAAEQHRDTKQKAHFQNPSITVPMQSTCVCSLRLTQIGRIHSERTFFALYKGILAVSRKAPLLLGCTGCCEGSTYSCSVPPLTKLSFIAYMSLLLSNCDRTSSIIKTAERLLCETSSGQFHISAQLAMLHTFMALLQDDCNDDQPFSIEHRQSRRSQGRSRRLDQTLKFHESVICVKARVP